MSIDEQKMKELVRAASGEVRLFPLQGLDAKPYPHMEELISVLRKEGIAAELVEIPFEFQRGSNILMNLRRREESSWPR